jgi:hypothetical protein
MLLNETPYELLDERRPDIRPDIYVIEAKIDGKIDGKNRAAPPHAPEAESVSVRPPPAPARKPHPRTPTETQTLPLEPQPLPQPQPELKPPEAGPWPDLDLRRPLPPAPVSGVLDLLAPVLDRQLFVVDQPPLPPASDLAALHRAELEADFTELPPTSAGAEPAIPARFAAGLPVLPHIEFPP